MQPCVNDWPGGWDCPMKISGHFIHVFPLKKPFFSPFWHGPPPGGHLLSILAPKWAALTLTQCTQHCVPGSHLHIPHQNSTSTCFRTVFQVLSCLTQLLTARTVYVRKDFIYVCRCVSAAGFCHLMADFAAIIIVEFLQQIFTASNWPILSCVCPQQVSALTADFATDFCHFGFFCRCVHSWPTQ